MEVEFPPFTCQLALPFSLAAIALRTLGCSTSALCLETVTGTNTRCYSTYSSDVPPRAMQAFLVITNCATHLARRSRSRGRYMQTVSDLSLPRTYCISDTVQ